MTSKNELGAIERDLYQLFDIVWAKFYAQIKDKPLFDKTEVDLTEAESFVLDKGPKWLQNIGYHRDLVGIQQQDASFCFEHNQDRPCKICAEKDRKLPPREWFERMKEQLREWIEKEPRADKIKVWFIESMETGEKGVEFEAMSRGLDATLDIYDWPRIGLVDGAEYTAEELLETGGAGE